MGILNSFFNQGKTISVGQIRKKIAQKNDNYIIIDVRTTGEYAGGSIESDNTVNVEMDQVLTFLEEHPEEKTKDIYLLCASGSRSGSVQKILQAQGIEATNIAGGMMAWQMTQ